MQKEQLMGSGKQGFRLAASTLNVGLIRASATQGGVAEEVGVEPTGPASAGPTGFEVRAPHREMSLFRYGC
ncbi:MAG: hypothetical protein RL434_2746 [Pseudomonadota bacterium]